MTQFWSTDSAPTVEHLKDNNNDVYSSCAFQVFISLLLIHKVVWCMDIKQVQVDVYDVCIVMTE